MIELDNQADILTREEYYPYGGTAVWSARSDIETKYKYVRYSGQERDASGLYYYGLRYYAPWLGRWLNPDPAGPVDGLNLFCMVTNNPVTRRDILGLGPLDWVRSRLQRSYERIDSGSSTNNSAPGRSPFETRAHIGTHHSRAPGPNPPLMPEQLGQFYIDLHRGNYTFAGSAITGTNEERQQSFRQHVTSELAMDIVASMANQALFYEPYREFAEIFEGAYGPASESNAVNRRSYDIEKITPEGVKINFEYEFDIESFQSLNSGDTFMAPSEGGFQARLNFSMFASVASGAEVSASGSPDELQFTSKYIDLPSIAISEIGSERAKNEELTQIGEPSNLNEAMSSAPPSSKGEQNLTQPQMLLSSSAANNPQAAFSAATATFLLFFMMMFMNRRSWH
uniref:RHS repeat-associated core domain-containing protein n=1 Tax=Burkholderia sp. GbtcB21 TaxID=2824766 RepID=UPI0027D2C0CD